MWSQANLRGFNLRVIRQSMSPLRLLLMKPLRYSPDSRRIARQFAPFPRFRQACAVGAASNGENQPAPCRGSNFAEFFIIDAHLSHDCLYSSPHERPDAETSDFSVFYLLACYCRRASRPASSTYLLRRDQSNGVRSGVRWLYRRQRCVSGCFDAAVETL